MADEPESGDLVELGGRRLRLPDWVAARMPAWRPSRGAGVLVVAALVIGLAAGYAAGDNARGGAALPAPSSSPAPSATQVFSVAGVPALTQDTGACSLQRGQDLVLGIQLTNQSPEPITLTTTKAVLPLGGLRQVTWQWATCGAIAAPPAQADAILLPGESAWMAVTFTVKNECPGPDPVEFSIGYLEQGKPATASVPGFPDLSEVPYSGCGTTTAAAAPSLALINWPAWHSAVAAGR
ncbi:MAG: hypothetical protein ACRDNO_20720 [Trebonia sp.]